MAMTARKKIVTVSCGVIVILLAVAVFAIQKSSREHGWWHECRDNCWLIDDAKKLCAEQRHLAIGTVVNWEDIQPYFTNSQYWGIQHPSPTGKPQCPGGGTYDLGKIGSRSMCSVPYHQWPNCKSKDSGSEWRD